MRLSDAQRRVMEKVARYECGLAVLGAPEADRLTEMGLLRRVDVPTGYCLHIITPKGRAALEADTRANAQGDEA